MAHTCVSIFGLNSNQVYSLVQNLLPRRAPVTGICEIESLKQLVICGLDSSLEFYEISERNHTAAAVNSQKPKTKSCLKNLFSKKSNNSGANEI